MQYHLNSEKSPLDNIKSIFLYFIFAFCCADSSLFATPQFSSQAIRTASRAKPIILNETNIIDHKAMLQATESIESILNAPSFRRLEAKDQLDILLLLSKAYEKLEAWEKQEKMLSTYAKKKELHRYYITLKIALANGFILQNRFSDAHAVLSNIIGKSCASLSQDEQRQITSVVLLQEKKLHELLQTADRLRLEGCHLEAIPIYRLLIVAMKEKSFPYQSSRMERKRLKVQTELALIECLLLSQNQNEALQLLEEIQKWSFDIFPESMRTRIEKTHRLLVTLNSSLYQKEEDQGIDLLLTSLKKEQPSDKLFLWQTLMGKKDEPPLSFPPIVQLFSSLSKGLFEEAQHCIDSILHQLPSSQIEKEIHAIALAVQIDLLWDEAMLYAFLNFQDGIETVMQKIEELQKKFPSSRGTERILFWKKQIETHSSIEEKRALFSLFQKKHPNFFSTTPLLTETASKAIKDATKYLNSTIIEEKKELLDTTQAALFSILPLIHNTSAKRHLIKIYTNILIEQEQYHEAFSLLFSLNSLSSQSHTSQAQDCMPLICRILLATKTVHERYLQEREKTYELLFQPSDRHSIYPYAILLHDDHAQKMVLKMTNHDISSSFFFSFSYASYWWKEAKKIFEEAEKAKDPGLMKEKYEASFTAYRETATTIASLLEKAQDESSPIFPLQQDMASILLSIDKEWLVHCISTFHRDNAIYNELRISLESIEKAIERHLPLIQYALQEKKEREYQEIQTIQSLVPLYTAVFSRNFLPAITQAQGYINRQENSPQVARGLLFLCHHLRENSLIEEEEPILLFLDEAQIRSQDHELSLSVAFEKALFFRSIQDYDRAMSYLAWIVNDPYASSLRVRSMLIRAEIYVEIDRIDLALRQLEAVATKGGEWAKVAERKLEEIQ